MWHTPDEQAHFAQVAFLADMGRNPGGGVLDTTEEIYISEQLLGTARDKTGNNRFTFHPDYNIEFTNSYYGIYEASISALADTGSETKLVTVEASYYPKLYYIPASWLYKFFHSSDLFTRLFVIRGWSLFLFIANIFFVYQTGKLIFSKSKLKTLVLTILIGFHPMMIFANIGVNSDALGNLLFTLFLYSCLRLISLGLKVKELILLGFISWLAVTTKTQFVVILPVIFTLFTFLTLRDIKGKLKYILLAILCLFVIIPISHPYSFKQLSALTVAADSLKEFNLSSFLKYTREYTFSHTINEVMPWYWGVYKWLGVTYPRFVHRVINRIAFISVMGFAIWLFRAVVKRKLGDHQFQSVIFLLFVSTVYFISISVYDWLSWYRSGFQLAVQGRYFFPLISFHMIAIILGWSTLLPNKWNLKQSGLKLIAGLMVFFNIYALYFVSSTYYDVSSLQKFIIQTSQYKPWFFKGNSILILFIIYIVSLLVSIVRLTLFKQRQKKI